jgi:Peptidase A4 family
MAAATPPARVSGTFLPGPRPGHSRIHAAPGVNSTSSTNWSGYVQAATENRTFTEVSDTMVVPAVVASANGIQYAADWVGIGGYSTAPRDSTLVQDGIQTIVTTSKGKTTTTYGAWTEILPQPEKPLDFAVNAGDVVTATVREVSKNKWKMTVDDTTTGQSATRTVKYRSKGLSAEAIHERPCIKGNCQSESDLATLADTANVTFGPGSYSESAPGATPVTEPLLGTVAGATLNEILMVDNNNTTIATPSDPSVAQDAFAVAYGDTPPPAPTN